MLACGDVGLQFRVVGLGFRVKDKVRVSVRDRVGVIELAARRIPHPRKPAFYQCP